MLTHFIGIVFLEPVAVIQVTLLQCLDVGVLTDTTYKQPLVVT